MRPMSDATQPNLLRCAPYFPVRDVGRSVAHYDGIMNDALDRPADYVSETSQRRIASAGAAEVEDQAADTLIRNGWAVDPDADPKKAEAKVRKLHAETSKVQAELDEKAEAEAKARAELEAAKLVDTTPTAEMKAETKAEVKSESSNARDSK